MSGGTSPYLVVRFVRLIPITSKTQVYYIDVPVTFADRFYATFSRTRQSNNMSAMALVVRGQKRAILKESTVLLLSNSTG